MAIIKKLDPHQLSKKFSTAFPCSRLILNIEQMMGSILTKNVDWIGRRGCGLLCIVRMAKMTEIRSFCNQNSKAFRTLTKCIISLEVSLVIALSIKRGAMKTKCHDLKHTGSREDQRQFGEIDSRPLMVIQHTLSIAIMTSSNDPLNFATTLFLHIESLGKAEGPNKSWSCWRFSVT